MDLVARGAARNAKGDKEGAQACWLAQALTRPELPGAWQNLALHAIEEDQRQAAIVLAKMAVDRAPNDVNARRNLGNILWRTGHYDDSRDELLKALSLDASDFLSWQNFGVLNMVVGDYPAAVECMTKAFSICTPEWRTLIAGDIGLALMYTGDFANGLAYVEAEWTKSTAPMADIDLPRWDGVERIEGKSLLVYHHHGMGDTLQFARFLPTIRKLSGARLKLRVPNALGKLFYDSELADEIFGDTEALPDADYKLPFAAVLRLAGLGSDEMLGQWPCPYLRPNLLRRSREEVGYFGTGQFNIGLVWGGNHKHTTGKDRSIPLECFLPLALLPKAKLFSLQVGPAAADIERIGAKALVHDLSWRIRDFSDLAELMSSMDLVISADTAPLHLAGAIGLPAIGILSRVAADWRWMERDSAESPWYPSLKLFWQPQPGDWDGAVDSVANHLRSDFF